MTMYKCDQCGEVWSKGPTRDAILEGWICPVCLRAKLQDAEERCQELTNDLRDACHVGLGQSAVLKSLKERAEAAEQAAAQIAVERACLEIDNHKLKAEVARLTEIITKTNTHISYRLDIERRTATKAALRWAKRNCSFVETGNEFVTRGLTALLGEGK